MTTPKPRSAHNIKVANCESFLGNHLSVGQLGENLVAESLAARGFQILERGWSCSRGEIDVIALKEPWLVAVEVKTKQGVEFGHPLHALRPGQLKRLQRALFMYQLNKINDYGKFRLRVDLYGVVLSPRGEAFAEIIEDVFI